MRMRYNLTVVRIAIIEKITVSKDMDYWSLYTIVGNVN